MKSSKTEAEVSEDRQAFTFFDFSLAVRRCFTSPLRVLDLAWMSEINLQGLNIGIAPGDQSELANN